MSDEFGRRKTDQPALLHIAEEIGRLKEGYTFAERGNQAILVKIQALEQRMDDKFDRLTDAIYGNGPDQVGIFERIRSLATKVAIILFIIGGIGGFVGRFLEKVIFK